MNNFFKFINKKSIRTFLTDRWTVCVRYNDGKIIEYVGITNPWKFITTMKKNISVINAWIKTEENG
jgi:hypothetical protein